MEIVISTYYTKENFKKLIPILEESKLNNLVKVLTHVQFDNEDFQRYLIDISEIVIDDNVTFSDFGKTSKVIVRGQTIQVSTKTSVDFHRKLKYLMYDISLEQLPKELGTIEKELLPIVYWRMEIEK